MDIIRIYNNGDDSIVKTFTNSADADSLEYILDFLDAEYERYHDEEKT